MTQKGESKYLRALMIARSENPDLNKVRDLLEAARKEKDERATYAIATWYLNGNSITPVDEDRGFNILSELDNSNISEAMFDLAVAYDLGKVVEQDDAKAFSYYMRAALLGDKEACRQVSQFYVEGKVVPFDEELGEAWLKRSQQDETEISPPYRVRLA